MTESRLIFTSDASAALDELLSGTDHSSVAVVTDSTVSPLLMPRFHLPAPIVIPAGEVHKNFDSLCGIYQGLTDSGVTRKSVIINIGGGMVTDLGGFAAATFKRGVRFVNIPTTLLGAVDAAVGGKTGYNFAGFKNEIGAFASPLAVIFDSKLFSTLPDVELLSGYGEMLKHSLLADAKLFADTLNFDVFDTLSPDFNALLQRNVAIKSAVIKSDPYEAGPRKALNLGHTAGHAIESLALRRNQHIPHGIAVANGLLVALILSNMVLGMSSELITPLAGRIRRAGMTPQFAITCDDYPGLLETMRHDKKNALPSAISFTLLREIGLPVTDVTIDAGQITAAMDIYRDLIGR